MARSFVACVLLVLLHLTLARGGAIIWKHPPSPSGSTPSPRVAPSPSELITTVAASYVPLLRQGDAFNETVTVPVTERTDTTSPLPAMIAAEDFSIPLALQTCSSLIADIVLFRQLGRGGNYRIPTRTTFWLFGEAQTTGPFNRSRALAERVFTQPSEGQYDPPGSTGGTTTDHGNGFYYHVERLRFVLGNLTLRSNMTYWLALLVSIDRAYNATDFSQNTVRWAVSETTDGSSSRPYRVVDWHHNTFRDVPALVNWTNASIAEAAILPSMTALGVHNSRTRQLALDLYATECNNVTRLPASLGLLATLPLRDASQSPPPPSPSPSHEVVAVITPSGLNENSPTSAPEPIPSPPSSPSSLETSWPSPPPSLAPTPSSTPPTLNPSSSSSSPVSPPLPPPTHVPTWTSPPPPSPSPATTGSGSPAVLTLPAPSAHNENVSVTQPAPRSTAVDTRTWIYVAVSALVLLVLLVGVFVIAVRRYTGNRKYTSLSHGDYIKESQGDPPSNEEEELAEAGGPQLPRFTDAPSSLLADDSGDAAHIRLDDDGPDEPPRVPATRKEAKDKQSMLLMQEVSLDNKNRK